MQNLILNDSFTKLNDLQLEYKVLPQISFNLPEELQIRITLNKHENVSHFKNVIVPSLLLIDDKNKPVFCFRSDNKHYNDSLSSKKKLKGIEDYLTKEFDDKYLKSSFNIVNKTDIGSINGNDDLLVVSKEPKLYPNPSVECSNLEPVR